MIFVVDESIANLPKHPLKRFEPTLRKFQVALPADLARLQQHKINMEKVSLNIPVGWSGEVHVRVPIMI